LHLVGYIGILFRAHPILHFSRIRVNTIVLLRMSTKLLETCNAEDSNKHIIEEIVREGGHLPEFLEDILLFQ
jgi:hypothetical protein